MTPAARGLFIAGTDTGCGKSFVTATIAASLATSGTTVSVRKPLLTGLDEPSTPANPLDHELLAMASGEPDPKVVSPIRFGPPMSPHLAAEKAGEEIDLASIASGLKEEMSTVPDRVMLVEGIGGLLVPITRTSSVADLAVEMGLPLIIAARPGLGTINHCLLTLEAARSRGLEVRAVVLSQWPDDPSEIELDNRKTVEELGNVKVMTVPHVAELTQDAFAKAAAGIDLGALTSPAVR
ncbi:MAG: dethiobiotin synthase [Solirubrobacterales bacterium]|nr:dethiobiotin synthase [Solirubrobacterales bacterium]